jgi:hypothetical protein
MMELDLFPFPWFPLLPNLFPIILLNYAKTPFIKTFFCPSTCSLGFMDSNNTP